MGCIRRAFVNVDVTVLVKSAWARRRPGFGLCSGSDYFCSLVESEDLFRPRLSHLESKGLSASPR